MAHLSDSDSVRAGRLAGARVIDAEGHLASVASIQQDGEAKAWVTLEDGTQVLVSVSLFEPQDDGALRLPFTLNLSNESRHPMQMTFPVMEEEVHVDKRLVETGRGVRIHKTVSESEEVIDQPLLRDELTVEYVPVGRVVEEGGSLPQTRYEGDTLVVPVLEEVLVVQKQMLLKEEVRITRRRHQVHMPESVLLRSEQIIVERFDDGRKP